MLDAVTLATPGQTSVSMETGHAHLLRRKGHPDEVADRLRSGNHDVEVTHCELDDIHGGVDNPS